MLLLKKQFAKTVPGTPQNGVLKAKGQALAVNDALLETKGPIVLDYVKSKITINPSNPLPGLDGMAPSVGESLYLGTRFWLDMGAPLSPGMELQKGINPRLGLHLVLRMPRAKAGVKRGSFPLPLAADVLFPPFLDLGLFVGLPEGHKPLTPHDHPVLSMVRYWPVPTLRHREAVWTDKVAANGGVFVPFIFVSDSIMQPRIVPVSVISALHLGPRWKDDATAILEKPKDSVVAIESKF